MSKASLYLPQLMILSAALLWALLGSFSKFLLLSGYTPYQVAFWRASIAFFAFAICALWKNEYKIRWKDLKVLAPFGLVGIALFYYCYQSSIQYIGAGLSSILLYTAPIWVAVLNSIFYGHKLTPSLGGAIALAFFGIAGLSLSSGTDGLRFNFMGLFWGLMSGFTYALFYVFGKTWLKPYSITKAFFHLYWVGSLSLVFLMPRGTVLWPSTGRDWGFAIALGIICTFIPAVLYLAALRRLNAVRASLLASIEPVFSYSLAFYFFGERLSPLGFLFAALVLVAVLWTVVSKPREEN